MQRLRLLLSVFSEAGRYQDGRPNVQALIDASGLSRAVVRPGNIAPRSQATMQRLTRAAADLLQLDADRLGAWLDGAEDPETEAFLQKQLDLRRCTGCGGWFPKKEIDPRRCQCRGCINVPRVNTWLQKVDRKIEQAPPKLRDAWRRARKDPSRSITYIRLAMLAKMDRDEFRLAWREAGLPDRPAKGVLVIAVLASILGGGGGQGLAASGLPPTGPTNVLVRPEEKRRRRRSPSIGGRPKSRSGSPTIYPIGCYELGAGGCP